MSMLQQFPTEVEYGKVALEIPVDEFKRVLVLLLDHIRTSVLYIYGKIPETTDCTQRSTNFLLRDPTRQGSEKVLQNTQYTVVE